MPVEADSRVPWSETAIIDMPPRQDETCLSPRVMLRPVPQHPVEVHVWPSWLDEVPRAKWVIPFMNDSGVFGAWLGPHVHYGR